MAVDIVRRRHGEHELVQQRDDGEGCDRRERVRRQKVEAREGGYEALRLAPEAVGHAPRALVLPSHVAGMHTTEEGPHGVARRRVARLVDGERTAAALLV